MRDRALSLVSSLVTGNPFHLEGVHADAQGNTPARVSLPNVLPVSSDDVHRHEHIESIVDSSPYVLLIEGDALVHLELFHQLVRDLEWQSSTRAQQLGVNFTSLYVVNSRSSTF